MTKTAFKVKEYEVGQFELIEQFPEAETMETRKVKEWSGARKFWMAMFTIAVLMTLGNYIISVISQ